MDLNGLAATRRSVRHYRDAGLPAEEVRAKVNRIVDFARANAPSWKNSQTHRYYVALSAEKIAAVRGALVERNQPKCDHAVALIVSAYERGVAGFSAGAQDNELGDEWGAYDLGLSDALLLLKARDEGLDTLVMGLRDAGALRAALGIPESQAVGAVISVGAREGDPPAPPRKALEEIARFV